MTSKPFVSPSIFYPIYGDVITPLILLAQVTFPLLIDIGIDPSNYLNPEKKKITSNSADV